MTTGLAVREISESDLQPYAELLTKNKTTWANPSSLDAPEARGRHILTSDMFRTFAAEDTHGVFQMSISIRRWTSLPVYTVTEFKTRAAMRLQVFKPVFAGLIGEMVSALECEGRFEFYYLIEDKEIYRKRPDRVGRNVMQYLVPTLSNYHIFNEARYAANELPKWNAHAAIVLNRTVSTPTVLRRAIHKSKLEDR